MINFKLFPIFSQNYVNIIPISFLILCQNYLNLKLPHPNLQIPEPGDKIDRETYTGPTPITINHPNTIQNTWKYVISSFKALDSNYSI